MTYGLYSSYILAVGGYRRRRHAPGCL